MGKNNEIDNLFFNSLILNNIPVFYYSLSKYSNALVNINPLLPNVPQMVRLAKFFILI